jgi:molybdopterin-guanine dinucleotide biosynthesis protein B
MKLFGLAGWSGSGKTTLIVRLIPELNRRGVAVSTVKHAHHAFDIDMPGKDSYEHRAAGAREVVVSSVNRWAIVHEHRGHAEASLAELLALLAPVDLVLIEGFKHADYEKLEVHRPAVGKPMLWPSDPTIVGVASDAPLAGVSLPVLALGDVAAIADFVVARCGLQRAASGVA